MAVKTGCEITLVMGDVDATEGVGLSRRESRFDSWVPGGLVEDAAASDPGEEVVVEVVVGAVVIGGVLEVFAPVDEASSGLVERCCCRNTSRPCCLGCSETSTCRAVWWVSDLRRRGGGWDILSATDTATTDTTACLSIDKSCMDCVNRVESAVASVEICP